MKRSNPRWSLQVVLKYGLALTLIFLVVGFRKIVQAAQTNLASIHIMEEAFNRSTDPLSMAYPTWHRRGVTWKALGKLKAGQYDEVENILNETQWDRNLLDASILASAYEEQGSYREAIHIWKQLGNFNRLFRIANRALESGKPQDAQLALETAMEMGPDQAARPLAQFLSTEMEDSPQAESILRYVLDRFPYTIYRTQWQFQLAGLLVKQKKWDEAIEIYQARLTDNPADWQARVGLAKAYQARGDDLDTVVAEFQKALENSDKPAVIYFWLSQVYQTRGLYNEADQWLTKAIALNPENASWALLRAQNALEAGSPQLAVQIYQQIIQEYEGKPEVSGPAYLGLAGIYWSDGRVDEATAAVDKALELQPVLTPATITGYLQAAIIYQDAGQADKAANLYKQILQFAPGNSKALEGLKRLSMP